MISAFLQSNTFYTMGVCRLLTLAWYQYAARQIFCNGWCDILSLICHPCTTELPGPIQVWCHPRMNTKRVGFAGHLCSRTHRFWDKLGNVFLYSGNGNPWGEHWGITPCFCDITSMPYSQCTLSVKVIRRKGRFVDHWCLCLMGILLQLKCGKSTFCPTHAGN